MTCTPTHNHTVTFAASGVTTLTLFAPEPGNSLQIDPHIIVHRARNDTTYCYKRGSLIKSMQLKFRKLEKSDHDLYIVFLAASAGKLITYTDHFGTAITGYIKDTTDPEVARSKGFEIDMQFTVA